MSILKKNLKVLAHRATPKFLLTRLAGVFARNELGEFTTWGIKKFAKHFNIDMTEAEKEDFADYKTFNEFFTRPLKSGVRPIDTDELHAVSPVDGTVAEFGKIEYDRLIAAKGQDYSLRNLLGNELEYKDFSGGEFACIYLSPANYHRIHMPVTGTLTKMVYIPGKYYSVNPTIVASIDELFTKNERVICFFDTEFGKMAMVLVGATIVGSIATVWENEISPKNKREKKVWNYENQAEKITIQKGEEMGRFYLGSTVITTFAPNKVTLAESLVTGNAIKLGEHLATKNL